jgi:hypothetical protein
MTLSTSNASESTKWRAHCEPLVSSVNGGVALRNGSTDLLVVLLEQGIDVDLLSTPDAIGLVLTIQA